MTYRTGKVVFPGWAMLGLVAAAALMGCSTMSLEDAAPQATATAPANTGRYPNLNIAPQNAAPQLTPEETSAKLAELQAVQSAAQASPGDPRAAADAAELATLAASHGSETLKQIESAPTVSGCDPALDPSCK